MFNDEFKYQYTSVPIAVFSRDHKANSIKSNIESLSHHHREFEILYVIDGEAIYYIDTQEYKIEKGDIVIVQPYLIHRATILASKNFSHCCLCFDLKIINDEPLKTGFEGGMITTNSIIKNTDECASVMCRYVVDAHNAVVNKNNGWELNSIGNLSLFFSKLKEAGLITESGTERQKKNFCYSIIKYIDSNYNQNITSNHASKALFMNNSYFCRKFKDNFGYCFQKYIEIYRIEKAKILLKTTSLPIYEIALSVGFHDFSYFSKIFKKSENITPSQYRKAYLLFENFWYNFFVLLKPSLTKSLYHCIIIKVNIKKRGTLWIRFRLI